MRAMRAEGELNLCFSGLPDSLVGTNYITLRRFLRPT